MIIIYIGTPELSLIIRETSLNHTEVNLLYCYIVFPVDSVLSAEML